MMMTGREVFERALMLLGYTNSYGETDPTNDAELYKRGTIAVQQIYDDLQRIEYPGRFISRPIDMVKPLPLHDVTIADVMPYGVAMLLAQSEGNGDSQALFAQLYNRKRSSVPKVPSKRINTIPHGGY